MTADTGTARPADSPPASRWEDFVDILYAPSLVFARRRGGGAAVPLLVVTFAVGVTFLITGESLRPIIDAEFDRAMAASMGGGQQVPPEAMERMRGFGMITARVGSFVFMPILITIGGAALWLAGKMLGASATFRASLMVAAYAHVPRVLEAVANSLQAVMLDPEQLDGQLRLSLGPARFLDPDTTSPMLLAVLGPLDFFTLWVTALLAIGLSVTGSVSRPRAAIGAALVWLVSLIPRLLGALSQM